MNKKLLAVAVASAMAAPIAAHADSSLTVYGGVGVAVESIDIESADATAVNNNHSAIGFEGSTDVNSNLAAVFHWDAFVNIDGGASDGGGADDSTGLIGGGRDGWAGLRGSFGTVALGFQGRPWKTLSHGLDPFQGTIADYSSVLGNGSGGIKGGGQGFDTGIGNSIIWFGPNINGFTWHAQYGTEDSGAAAAGDSFGVQGNYSNDQFFIGASFDSDENTTANQSDLEVFKLVGSINFGSATVTAAFENIDGLGATTNDDRDAFWVAGTFDLGHGSVRAAYTMADETNSDDNGADQFSLGYFGDLSDNAEWYVIYSAVNNDSAGRYGFVSAPHTSSIDSTLANTAVVAGNDSDAIALGIKYNFAADLI